MTDEVGGDQLCLFCRRNLASEADAYGQVMYRYFGRPELVMISVPRCASCRWLQWRSMATDWLMLVVSVWLVVYGLATRHHDPLMIGLILMPVVMLGAAMKFGGISARQRSALREYGPVAELLAAGWSIRKRPTLR